MPRNLGDGLTVLDHEHSRDHQVLEALRRLIGIILKGGLYEFLLKVGWKWALGIVLLVVGLAVLVMVLIAVLVAVLV